MNHHQPEIDIIKDILEAMLKAKPESPFISSLYKQYCERGGLSRKQLEGLHAKAIRVKEIKANKLATLQAIILRKPVRYKSEVSKITITNKQDSYHLIVKAILEKYPEHIAVLLLSHKLDKGIELSVVEKESIKRFEKLLLKPTSDK